MFLVDKLTDCSPQVWIFVETSSSGSLAVSLSLGAALHVPVCASLCHHFDFLLVGSFMMEHWLSEIYSHQDDFYILRLCCL